MKNYDLNQVIFLLKNSFDLNRDLNHPDLNWPTLLIMLLCQYLHCLTLLP